MNAYTEALAAAGWPPLYRRVPPVRSGPSFLVMQFNTLADGLCYNTFERCPREAVEWPMRRLRLMEEILGANADVVCLQECNHFTDWFEPEMAAAGYRGVFVPKVHSPCTALQYPSDGCAIFYRSPLFRLWDDAPALSQPELPLETSHRAVVPFQLDRHGGQVGLALLLQSDALFGSADTVLCVATCHLRSKAGKSNDALRARQISAVVRCLEGLRADVLASGKRFQLVLCGDMNEEPDGQVYRTLRDCALHDTQPERPITTWKWRDGVLQRRTIDYIWSTLRAVGRFGAAADGVAPISDDALPCYAYPSDHFSVVAALQV